MHPSLLDVVLQLINFLVLAWLLKRFLFKPVRAVIARREEAMTALRREAAAKLSEAERAAEGYEAEKARVAAAAERERAQVLSLATQDAVRIRDEKVREVEVELARARREIEQERTQALRALETRVADLASSIAARLLREMQTDDGPFLWRITASIDALEPSRRVALAAELTHAAVEVASSRPLDDSTRQRFERWLSRLGEADVSVAYSVDATLIAGVEVRLSSGVWRSNWRALLEHIRAEMIAHDTAA